VSRAPGRLLSHEAAREGEVLRTLRRLEVAMTDTGARRAYLITQAYGTSPLAAGVERRGFSSCIDWLP
jgi:hypothetical protein